MDLLAHAQKMRSQAKFLLEDSKALAILNQVGNVSVCGSYKHDLMYDPDIDLFVRTDTPRESSLQALELLLQEKNFQKYEYGDFVDHPRPNRPSGYIICLRKEIEGVKWEIEIWFLSDEKPDCLENVDITPEKQLEILQAKHDRSQSSTSKHEMSSFEIYKKILRLS
ncbi:MAG: hypothetical protein H6502_05525 [Candidatus Woesearchaeota archaeon]|nr:MAG: hypothetical protein H6502_05525 [Candidatus Woesearchaeota archaeon]